MVKRITATLFVLVLALSFSLVTFVQGATKQEAKKEEKKTEMKKNDKMAMTKEEKATGPLKSVSCDPTCGFMCRSHNEKELISVVKAHAKKMHKMDMTDAKVKEMMKTEEGGEMKK